MYHIIGRHDMLSCFTTFVRSAAGIILYRAIYVYTEYISMVGMLFVLGDVLKCAIYVGNLSQGCSVTTKNIWVGHVSQRCFRGRSVCWTCQQARTCRVYNTCRERFSQGCTDWLTCAICVAHVIVLTIVLCMLKSALIGGINNRHP